ncbi:MAG: glycosyltransferase family 4 protein [Candidatus Woesebacteria bacterium]|jgi:glycosyltransferase EpsD
MTKSAKKVLFTSHTANFSKFNRPFMRMLAQQGYEVHYASAGEEEVKDCNKHFTIPFERNPFKLNNLRALIKLKKIIDAQNYSIIHTHTPMGSVVTRLAAISARKKGTRIIYTAHGFHFFKSAPILNWLIYYPIEKIMARYTDTLITINREDYNRASKKFKTDTQYVPGVGVDIAKFDIKMTTAERNKIRKTLGLKPDDFVMIYVAELSKRKNQLWLIQTIAQLIHDDPKIHLLLPGQDSLNGRCQALAQKIKLDKNIHFLGYRKDIPQLMKISDLAVSSSTQEGLPVNIMEAMMSKLPVITAACRGADELINDGVNGYIFDLKKSAQLMNGVIDIHSNNDIRKRVSKEYKNNIKKYTLPNILKYMARIYGDG